MGSCFDDKDGRNPLADPFAFGAGGSGDYSTMWPNDGSNYHGRQDGHGGTAL